MTLGLFEKRIAGDDCLMELARQRFLEVGMGAEMPAATPGDLEQILRYRPSLETPVVVHLARELNLAEEWSRRQIQAFAARFAGRVLGLVVHDRMSLASHPGVFLDAARDLQSQLESIPGSPRLFIEYAAGLEPAEFAGLFRSIRELGRISACIDIGHVGIWQARNAYARLHPGTDICGLKSNPAQLSRLMDDVQLAVRSALPTVLELIETLGAFGKPVHFHLHDAHPLSSFSPFGVSDHLSFFQEIALDFEHHGRRTVPPMFGLDGLDRVVAQAVEKIGLDRVSFTLEIHPTADRLSLGDAAPLFGHWRDKTHAEQMNHWLAVLVRNHERLSRACG